MSQRFGPVVIRNFLITWLEPTLVVAEGPHPDVYRELYIYSHTPSYRSESSDKLLYLIDPVDEVPYLHQLAKVGGYVVYENQLFISPGEVELNTRDIRFITDEERARFAQLTFQ